jgi:hypothetical protein
MTKSKTSRWARITVVAAAVRGACAGAARAVVSWLLDKV